MASRTRSQGTRRTSPPAGGGGRKSAASTAAGPRRTGTESSAGRGGHKGAPSITVTVRVEARHRGAVKDIAPDSTLHAGDGIAVHVTLDREALLYVVRFDERGWSELLFPVGGDRLIEADTPARVPAAGTWHKLAGPPGERNLYVVVSSGPLDARHPTVWEWLRLQPRADGSRGLPPPPPGRPIGERDGATWDEETRSLTLRAPLDPAPLIGFAFHIAK